MGTEKTCWECGGPPPLHDHHPVPRSRGGHRTIPLCEECHGKAHHRDKAMSITALTRAALAAKKARGERTGEVPFGSRVAADGRTLEADAGEAAVVDAVRELRAAGRTLRAVVTELDRRGFRSRAGKPLTLTQVARILKPVAPCP